MQTTQFERDFISTALKQLGAPYIWGGHGDVVWTPKNPVGMQKAAGCPRGFDCAGLVTWTVHQISTTDLTNSWNAQTMWDRLPEAAPDSFALALYGSRADLIQHVAVVLGNTNLLLQAAGGDSTTTSYTEAVRRSACVSVGYRGRQDLLGYRSLAALEKAVP